MPAVCARVKGGKNYFQGKYHFTVTKLLEQRLMPAARACVKMKKTSLFRWQNRPISFHTQKKQTYFLSQKKAYFDGKKRPIPMARELCSHVTRG